MAIILSFLFLVQTALAHQTSYEVFPNRWPTCRERVAEAKDRIVGAFDIYGYRGAERRKQLSPWGTLERGLFVRGYLYHLKHDLKGFVSMSDPHSRISKIATHTLDSIQRRVPSITILEAEAFLQAFWGGQFPPVDPQIEGLFPVFHLVFADLYESDPMLQRQSLLFIEALMCDEQLAVYFTKPFSGWSLRRESRRKWKAFQARMDLKPPQPIP